MTKVVVIAVLALAAIAAADTIRPEGTETRVAPPSTPRAAVRHPVASSGFMPAGSRIRNRVLLHGREYLGPEEIARAFPRPLPGALFDIAHLAAGPDGTLVLAIYGFDPGNAASAIQVWRDGELESSFLVRPGTFGGGIGFAAEGRLIAALSPDGRVVNLFTRSGEPAGRQSPTSW
jgi:hypothetical protein